MTELDAIELHFRRAAATDIAGIVSLVEAAYRGDESRVGWTTEADLLDGQRTDSGAVATTLTEAGSVILLAEFDEELVACCQLESRAQNTAYFGMFSVRPGLQGRGVGRRVIAEAERFARDEWSAQRIRMTVIRQRPELIAWYARLGFTPTGETAPFPYGDVRFGIPKRADLEFVVLAKSL